MGKAFDDRIGCMCLIEAEGKDGCFACLCLHRSGGGRAQGGTGCAGPCECRRGHCLRRNVCA
jgi:hypothetical protein